MLGWICCSQLVLLRCPLWRPTLRSVDLLAFVNETWGDEADGEAASTPAAVEAPLLTSVLQDELSRLPSRNFEDVTGDIRLLRFLRGFDHSVPQAVAAVPPSPAGASKTFATQSLA